MPEPQESRAGTGGRDDAASSAESTGDFPADFSDGFPETETSDTVPEPEDSFEWPAEDPEQHSTQAQSAQSSDAQSPESQSEEHRQENSPQEDSRQEDSRQEEHQQEEPRPATTEPTSETSDSEPEWPEQDPAAVERTQRFSAIRPTEQEPDQSRQDSDQQRQDSGQQEQDSEQCGQESGQRDQEAGGSPAPGSAPATDPPTIRMPRIPAADPGWPRAEPDPAEHRERLEQRTERFTAQQRHHQSGNAAGEQQGAPTGSRHPGPARPAAPADFDIPIGSETTSAWPPRQDPGRAGGQATPWEPGASPHSARGGEFPRDGEYDEAGTVEQELLPRRDEQADQEVGPHQVGTAHPVDASRSAETSQPVEPSQPAEPAPRTEAAHPADTAEPAARGSEENPTTGTAAALDHDDHESDHHDSDHHDGDHDDYGDLDGDSPESGEAVPAASGEPPPRGRRRTLVLSAVALLGVIAIAAVLVFRGSGWFGDVLNPRADPPAPVSLRPDVKGLNASAPLPTEQGVEAKLEEIASNPVLGDFGAVVRDARSGRTLWERNPDQGLVPASTDKLLTASAALLAIDHDFRFRTKVVRGSEPGSIVLVGGGDPTLSALPEGESSVYPGAARLDELVERIRSTTSGDIESVKVDVSRYSGPGLADSWDPADVARGYVAPIQPVMLDGGRQDPKSKVSSRSDEPALDAARELASRLGAPTSSVSRTTVDSGASTLAEVESPPLRDLVRKTLRDSDNVLAEALARQVAITTGNEPSFSGAVRAVRTVLSENGFDLTGVDIVDGSGLSASDELPARILGAIMRTASAPVESPSGRSARLRPLLTSVPVAGGTGGLAGRYDGDAAEGSGWVRAKTGTLTGTNALAGTVVTRDGRLLAFAFLSNGRNPVSVRPVIDELAAALRTCGCR
ncbi:D-alanyl-D-alanine carboxypeptidase / D-alanyl-D-alanine-endopeptidase (penicillin-binding protein 4) [Actinopolyspora alba]|uniref:D-alanyl-D-alanine carboxypeptidase / D-alanyl-D-alanine-endopeptidase (Penicillin-binding protein 4) n=1 Tax=Actinopolyspora alba TaxID=673379 RepID=A0A1I1VYL8_9ACTN|nr:D-alanyl-D-alanine carboxypeptidase/D-alanyl-D-alanine-endopeptidase [Actinopolyspora alba]SFD88052.1 D-alanyl-D-alanine carboxypeptidase / D-alanyl-D-alanine-endopeptidase (penicillin-binding protein 4) [Actinopolyspora alba]